MVDREEVLRRLTLGDEAFMDTLLGARRRPPQSALLSHKDDTLLRLGALAASGGSDLTWQQTVGAGLDDGLTPDEVVDALLALAPMIGFTRVVAIAPKIALGLGYDAEAAMEAPPSPRSGRMGAVTPRT